jgi:hypothetical protein
VVVFDGTNHQSTLKQRAFVTVLKSFLDTHREHS